MKVMQGIGKKRDGRGVNGRGNSKRETGLMMPLW